MQSAKTMAIKRRGGSKSVTRVRGVKIGQGKVAITIYLAKKDALNLAEKIRKQWPQ